MLVKFKRNGASSTAGDTAKKGYRGRLELVTEKREDGFHVTFRDVGNYGKDRWAADFGVLTSEELLAMAEQLTAVAAGQLQSTALATETVDALVAQIEAAANPPTAEAIEAVEAPAAEDTPAVAESEDSDGIEQLEA